jgi:uncharacterized protein YndB with AHSA1/START domain
MMVRSAVRRTGYARIVCVMHAEVTESTTIAASPSALYEAVSDIRGMARWSPECFAVLVYARRDGKPHRFVGFNRRGPWLWFTTCRVVTARPGEEFAFDVTTFGMPVSRWSYRLVPGADGAEVTEVTEAWLDRRNSGSRLLGRIFTGRVAINREQANQEGMRTTLARLKRELEAG